MEEASALIIKSESDAWEVLSLIVSESFDFEKYGAGIHFSDWLSQLMVVDSTPINGSMNTSLMRVFMEYQASIQKSYKILKYGVNSNKRLKDYERDFLDLNIVVREGSSVYNTEGGSFLDKMLREVVGKMEPKQIPITIIICVLIVALSYFGSEMFTAYWKAQSSMKEIEAKLQEEKIRSEERASLSEKESARQNTLLIAMLKSEEARAVVAQAETAHRTLLKGAVIADGARIHGVEVTAEKAAQVLSNPRRSGMPAALDGEYEVVEITREDDGAFLVDLRNVASGVLVNAEARELLLPREQVDILFKALRREGHKVQVILNAWQIEGRITSAAIARVSEGE